ncbi:MAG TPA: type 1 glutamine amidotransferase [candidate division WOR-3 bacterium]|uniref:Type 1 glutamine amidotransferase n=1 Tax=candidate division WOR-3 bacterium TaxID=2052148 RepID=A0A7V5HMA2_UNCW3|nr:type 1 glutamine amidotransferase [candidate division WOR-3 bacterium]
MKKIAILIEDLVEEVEFLYPFYRFREEGFEIQVVGPEKRAYKGKHGMVFNADKAIEEVKNKLYDLIFIPGGYCPDRLRRSEEILNFVKSHYEKDKLVAAICHGPWVLISAGITKGKKITGYFSIKDDIINSGARYVDEPAVEDGNIITAQNPASMPKMLKIILKKLGV